MDGRITTTDILSDVRRKVFFSFFLDPKAKTYSNIFESALLSNFSKEEAGLISHEAWFLSGIGKERREKIFDGAENFLLQLVNMETKDEEGNQSPALLAVKLKGALAGLEGLGKDFYSKRTEENKNITNVNIFKVLDQIEHGEYTHSEDGSAVIRQVVEVEQLVQGD
jgi:hypothetical protein